MKTKISWLAKILERHKNHVQPLTEKEKKETKGSASYKNKDRLVLKLWCS